MGTRAVTLTGGRRFLGEDRTEILAGVDLTVDVGETLVLLGGSGVGKSTLLRVLGALDDLDGGTITWADTAPGQKPHTGVVFQKPLLMPWLTVRENVGFGGRFAANKQHFDADRAAGLIDRFGLAACADAYPDQLSGGQAQRVAVIRAIAIAPTLLLLDEPFSALDPAIRADLQDWLRDLTAELGTTTVLVTHDIDEALTVGDRIVLIGAGGRVRKQWLTADDDAAGALRREILAAYRDKQLVGAGTGDGR